MTDLQKNIYEIVKQNENGIKARQIARLLGVDKTMVNSCLYGQMSSMCYIDEAYFWHPIENTECIEDDTADSSVIDEAYISNIILAFDNKDDVPDEEETIEFVGESDVAFVEENDDELDEDYNEDYNEDYDEEYDEEHLFWSAGIDFNEFIEGNDLKKYALIEKNGVSLDEFECYFEDDGSLAYIDDELYMELALNNIDVDIFVNSSDDEKEELLKQAGLDYIDYLELFDDSRYESTLYKTLSFEEYDYWNGNSYIPYESYLKDNIEGNDDCHSKTDVDKEFIDYYTRDRDYTIYRNLSRWYPELEQYVKELLNIKPDKNEARSLINELKRGNDSCRDRLAEIYAPSILRYSFCEYLKCRDYDFFEIWGICLELLLEGIEMVAHSNRFNTPLHYAKAKWSFIRRDMSRWFPYDSTLSAPNSIKSMYRKYLEFDDDIKKEILCIMENALYFKKEENESRWVCENIGELQWYLGTSVRKDMYGFYLFCRLEYLSTEHIEEESQKTFYNIPQELVVESIEDTVFNNIYSSYLKEALSTLTDRERRVIYYRFGFEECGCLLLYEVGRIFGLTRERIRQIEAKSLRKIKKFFRDLGIERIEI